MDSDEDKRRRAVVQTIASFRLDGLEPPPGYLAQLESYIRGELTLAELRQQTDAVYAAGHVVPGHLDTEA